ncbi:guanylate kinase [bacterium]|nr:guanylate kinase [bacterium]
MNIDNKLVVFCGPSGAGKSTIAQKIIREIPYFEFSVSATTRKPRNGEQEGVHYYYLEIDEFEAKIANNEFLEYEQVYEGLYYGTLKAELERIRNKGKIPILDLDVKGASHLKEAYGSDGLFVFVHPGSIDILAERLKKRGTEDDRSIEKRIRRASFELEYANKFDYVLHNDILERADKEIAEVITNYLKK